MTDTTVTVDPPEGERTWAVHWHCTPPSYADTYRVTADTWDTGGDDVVRHIYAFEIEAKEPQ